MSSFHLSGLHKQLIVLVVCILLSQCSYAQETVTFTLQGTINVNEGTMVLMPVVPYEPYYPFKANMETSVVKGKFSFSDSISYPTAYLLGLKVYGQLRYLSGIFFVNAGLNKVTCNRDSLRVTPDIANKSMDEYRGRYFTAIRNKGTLLQYARSYPDSYIALWALVSYVNFGYRPVYDTVYSALAPELRNTHTGKIIAQQIQAAKCTSVGGTFPQLQLSDTHDIPVVVPQADKKNKYTLVDFWFSHCNPCIAQFSMFKNIYDTYKDKGFEIIGISTDAKTDIELWKEIIKQKELNWPQYLDVDSKNADRLSINFTPANFLLDQNGVIIRKNIEPMELAEFLHKNI